MKSDNHRVDCRFIYGNSVNDAKNINCEKLDNDVYILGDIVLFNMLPDGSPTYGKMEKRCDICSQNYKASACTIKDHVFSDVIVSTMRLYNSTHDWWMLENLIQVQVRSLNLL
jgi:hypothetical protein